MERISDKELTFTQQLKDMAKNYTGLYRPNNLIDALNKIGQSNGIQPWVDLKSEKRARKVAYFLGQEQACMLCSSYQSRSGFEPFSQLDRFNFPADLTDSENPVDVLLVGCASAASYSLEQNALNKAGIKVKNQWTVDISKLPLKRIRRLIPNTEFINELSQLNKEKIYRGIIGGKQILLNDDIRSSEVPENHFNLVLTDLFFGSSPRQVEEKILRSICLKLKNKGKLVLKASVLTDENIDYLKPLMDSIGEIWRDHIINIYGENQQRGIDNFIGLSETQWMEFGKLYSDFMRETYFGDNRFKSYQEVEDFVQGNNLFRITDQVIDKELINPDEESAQFITFLAEKVG